MCSVFLACCQSGAAFAGVNDFYFSDYDVEFYLMRQTDGVSKMEVTERLTAEFPNFNQNHGIVRVIPTTNNDGRNLVMDPNTLYMSAWRNGEREAINNISEDKTYHEAQIGSSNVYVHGTQHYELKYAFERVIMDFGDWQELYWDTNGTGWKQKFEAARATVYLDEAGLAGWTGEAWCYVGKYGESGQSRCDWTKVDGGVEFWVRDDGPLAVLMPGENMTIVLKFAAGTFVVPATPQNYTLLIAGAIFAILTTAAIVLMMMFWGKYRDKYKKWKHSPIAPEYQPMEGVTAGQAQRLMLKGVRAGAQNITATVIELAVQGKVKIVQKEKAGLFGAKWEVKVLSLAGLKESERLSLEYLNGGKSVQDETTIEIKKRRSSTGLAAIFKVIGVKTESELESAGYMKKAKAGWAGVIVVVYVMAWFSLMLLMVIMMDDTVGVDVMGEWLMVPVTFAGVIVMVWLIARNTKITKFAERTDEGLRAEVYLQGLKRYMELAERDRIRVLQSVKGAERIDIDDKKKLVKLYEKLLPYAVIFGIDKSWAKEMEPLYAEGGTAPGWYVGVGAWSAMSFSSNMSSFSSYATSSATSSSGSSGSGGGGSSGGGGGGGGGGGW